ncbi:MAG: hypothetical protein RIS36_1189 [Pseudomonadota bacterium]
MPFAGTIVSHDLSLHTGLVLPDGNVQAISFTEGDVLNWHRTSPLFGQRVSFEVVRTPQGYAAIQMFLLNEKAPRLFESREIAASFVAPLLVAATTYALSTFFLLPPVFAYLPAINFITAIMFFLVAGTRRGHRPSPPEVTLLGLAMCGGAPILLLLLVLTRTRLRAEGIILLIFSAFLMQAILIKKYYPLVYDRRAWAMYLSAAEMQRIHIPLFGDLP